MSAEIEVTGLGLVTALGADVAANWAALVAGRSGLGALTLFPSARCGHFPVAQVRTVAQEPGEGAAHARTIRLLEIAGAQACRDAGIDPPRIGRRMALVVGVCTGGMLETEEFLRNLVTHNTLDPNLVREHCLGTVTEAVAQRLGIAGELTTISTACSSGATAIAAAGAILLRGEADVVLAVGGDSLTRLTLNGFASLLAVDADGCRPFDARRRGMSLGEGAGAILLESIDHARHRQAKSRATLRGWAATCDAYHPTAPSPQGEGLVRALHQALAQAECPPEEVGYINAHGTGTRENDAAEAAAIRTVFGSRIPAVSSTKRFFGHTLAGAGAIEAVVSVLALENQWAPGNLGLEQTAPEIGFEPMRLGTPLALRTVVSNSLGFGGNNCVLVFGRPEPASAPRASQGNNWEPLDILAASAVGPGGVCTTLELPAGSCRPAVAAYRRATDTPIPGVPPGLMRRIGHAQKMALAASAGVMGRLPADADRARTAVCLGTSLGTVTETADFLVHMIRQNEAEPKVTSFVNSVHNAMATQIAIAFALRGANMTFSHGRHSGQAALRHALRTLAAGESDAVLACGTDELHPIVAAVQAADDAWQPGDGPLRPLAADDAHRRGSLPGEGAAALLLARAGRWPGRVASLTGFVCGPTSPLRDPDFAAREAAAISALLAQSPRDKPPTLLLAANGDCRLDALYRRVLEVLSREYATPLPTRTFKQECGEFCAAWMYGLVRAVDCLAQGVSEVVYYDLQPGGLRTIVRVTP